MSSGRTQAKMHLHNITQAALCICRDCMLSPAAVHACTAHPMTSMPDNGMSLVESDRKGSTQMASHGAHHFVVTQSVQLNALAASIKESCLGLLTYLIVPLTSAQLLPPHKAGCVTKNTSGMNPAPPPHCPLQEVLSGTIKLPVQFTGQGVVLLQGVCCLVVPCATGQSVPL
jgi:hypothetical protein